MKNGRISLYNLLLMIWTVFYLLPYDGMIIFFLRNGLFLAGILILFLNKYQPSKYVWLVGIYNLYVLVLSYYNKTDTANFSSIIFYAKICIYAAYLELCLKKNAKSTVSSLYFVIMLFALINTATVIVLPNGLFQMPVYWGYWHGYSYIPHWLLGNKNTQASFYLLFQLLGITVSSYYKEKRITIPVVVITTSIVNMIFIKSSTSLVCVLIASIAFAISLMRNGKGLPKIKTKMIIIAFLVLEIAVVFGFTSFLEPFVKTFFKKDLTFSARTDLWKNLFVFILQKPIWGWGDVGGKESGAMLENIGWVNAHNQLLNIVWQGGVILLIYSIICLFLIAKKIDQEERNQIRFGTGLILFAVLIDSVFEVITGNIAFWILLLMICHTKDVVNYKPLGSPLHQ